MIQIIQLIELHQMLRTFIILFAILAFISASYALSNLDISFSEFQEFHQNNPLALDAIQNSSEMHKYLLHEQSFDRITNAVNSYEKTLPTCPEKDSSFETTGTLLVVTDMQKAFGSKGAVAVPDAENAISRINNAKKYHELAVHTLDTHLEYWSESFSLEPNYVNTFPPHARPGTDDYREMEGLDTCANLYLGKIEFSITSNPDFKTYLLSKKVTKVTFTGVAGDFCVNGGILGILEDPELSHVKVGLYQPGVRWVFPETTIPKQRSHFGTFSQFTWLNTEDEMVEWLKM